MIYNKEIVNRVKGTLSEYRYNSIKKFYNRCIEVHNKIAKDIKTYAIQNNFENEFKLPYTYIIPKDDLYNYNSKITDNIKDTELNISIKYINKNNNLVINSDITNEDLIIYINLYYIFDNDHNIIREQLHRLEHNIRTELFYLEFCLTNSITEDSDSNYTNDLSNDINISNGIFSFITKMILLLSPTEKVYRERRVQNIISGLTDDKINIICYKKHGIDRISCLINYTIDNSYYNILYFFLLHFMDKDLDDIRVIFYLGYFLQKLDIKDFSITKEYIVTIKDINYIFSKRDLILSEDVYNYYDEFYNEYIFSFFKLIDNTLTDDSLD